MRLIDADSLMKRLEMAESCEDCPSANSSGPCSNHKRTWEICQAIEEAPTVDAVEVVRCEECRWYDKSTASGTYEPIAYKCILHQRFTIGIQFCSDGERQEEDDLQMCANHYGERREE